MTLTDIGANLTHDSFDADRDSVLARAGDAGVSRLVVTGSDLASSRAAIDLAAHQPDCHATAGLHPHHARDWGNELAALMRNAAQQGDVAALGEMGLDFFRDISPRDAQEDCFRAQLAIACEQQMPVFLHQREAHDRFLPILQEYLPDLPRAVVHCFTDDAAALDACLEHDLYVGITGWVCDERRGGALYDIIDRIPDDRLMIETDCPYLLPRNIRPRPKSRRNEPAYLPWVLESVARARNQSREHVAAVTTANAQRFFALPASA